MEEISTKDELAVPDVLAALRTATAARHAELDAQTPLASEQVGQDDYRAHLQLLEQWLAPIAAWLGRFDDGPALPDYLAVIRADLAHAAPGDKQQPALATTDAAAWPAQASAAWRWGVCYVIEGSQLGGAVLYKRLSASLAPHPLNYLRGNGSPGPHWQRFISALRAAVVEPAQIADACEGAREAFDRLIALNRVRSDG